MAKVMLSGGNESNDPIPMAKVMPRPIEGVWKCASNWISLGAVFLIFSEALLLIFSHSPFCLFFANLFGQQDIEGMIEQSHIILPIIFIFQMVGHMLLAIGVRQLNQDRNLPKDIGRMSEIMWNVTVVWVILFWLGVIMIPFMNSGGVINFVDDLDSAKEMTPILMVFHIALFLSSALFVFVWYFLQKIFRTIRSNYYWHLEDTGVIFGYIGACIFMVGIVLWMLGIVESSVNGTYSEIGASGLIINYLWRGWILPIAFIWADIGILQYGEFMRQVSERRYLGHIPYALLQTPSPSQHLPTPRLENK